MSWGLFIILKHEKF